GRGLRRPTRGKAAPRRSQPGTGTRRCGPPPSDIRPSSRPSARSACPGGGWAPPRPSPELLRRWRQVRTRTPSFPPGLGPSLDYSTVASVESITSRPEERTMGPTGNDCYWNRATQTAPREVLDRMHLERLRNLVGWAYEHSPLHRRLYDDAGVKPGDIVTWDDFFHRLPFTDK